MKLQKTATALLLVFSSFGMVRAEKSIAEVQASLDSLGQKQKQMEQMESRVRAKSDSVKAQLDALGKKIEEAKEEPKVNYWLPILGGAILGIGLAVWMRSRKKKSA